VYFWVVNELRFDYYPIHYSRSIVEAWCSGTEMRDAEWKKRISVSLCAGF